MAKLVCIKSNTLRPNVNNIGDVVGVFQDNWKFSQAEQNQFDIIDIEGAKEEVEAKLQAQLPVEKEVYINTKGEYLDLPEQINIKVAKQQYCSGKILDKTVDTFTIQEKEFRIEFTCNAETKYDYDDSFDTLAIDQNVSVTYLPFDGKNNALLVRVDRKRIKLWDDNGIWRELVKSPKYRHTLNMLTEYEKVDLSSKDTAVLNSVISKIQPTLKLNIDNITAKVVDITAPITEIG